MWNFFAPNGDRKECCLDFSTLYVVGFSVIFFSIWEENLQEKLTFLVQQDEQALWGKAHGAHKNKKNPTFQLFSEKQRASENKRKGIWNLKMPSK